MPHKASSELVYISMVWLQDIDWQCHVADWISSLEPSVGRSEPAKSVTQYNRTKTTAAEAKKATSVHGSAPEKDSHSHISAKGETRIHMQAAFIVLYTLSRYSRYSRLSNCRCLVTSWHEVQCSLGVWVCFQTWSEEHRARHNVASSQLPLILFFCLQRGTFQEIQISLAGRPWKGTCSVP